MAEAAAQRTHAVTRERYAHSLSGMRQLGRIATLGELQTQQGESLRRQEYTNFITAIEENLKTDETFRAHLDVESRHTFNMNNGRVVGTDGQTIVSILERGLESSRLAAEHDPRMEAQAVRDAGDLTNAQAVDVMAEGTARFCLSMDPKSELAADKEYWSELGYRENIAYLQWYAKSGGRVVSGAYSIDKSDMDSWRALFLELGVTVPEDESSNTWIRHALERQLDPLQAEQFAREIRSRYYNSVGDMRTRLSVTDFVAARSPITGSLFQAYYLPLSEAVYSGIKNSVVHDLAASLLGASNGLDHNVRQQLMRIVHLNTFDSEAGRVLEAAVRYAVVEELRKGLQGHIFGRPVENGAVLTVFDMTMSQERQLAQLHQILAQNVQAGAQAGRSYGGCSGIRLGAAKTTAGGIESTPQEAYGGARPEGAVIEADNEPCDYVHDGCYCCPYSDAGEPLNYRLMVTARRDVKGTARCLRSGCGAAIDSQGKRLSPSRIAERARLLEQQKKQSGLGQQAMRVVAGRQAEAVDSRAGGLPLQALRSV